MHIQKWMYNCYTAAKKNFCLYSLCVPPPPMIQLDPSILINKKRNARKYTRVQFIVVERRISLFLKWRFPPLTQKASWIIVIGWFTKAILSIFSVKMKKLYKQAAMSGRGVPQNGPELFIFTLGVKSISTALLFFRIIRIYFFRTLLS